MNTYQQTALGNWKCLLQKPLPIHIHGKRFHANTITFITVRMDGQQSVMLSDNHSFNHHVTTFSTIGIVTILDELPL